MLVCQYFVWFMLYSVIGWVYESIYCSIQQRQLVNRGFLNGPLCPIYGAGAILVLFLFRSLQNPALIFIAGALATGVLEYVTSWLMEKLFPARWWDYEDWRFNLHGRVCLAGVAAFGAMSVILIKGIHPLVAVLTSRMAPGAVGATAGVLLLLLLVDTAITTMRLLKLNEKLKQVHQHVIARIGESRLHAETMKKSVEEGIASLKTNGIASQMRELVQRLTKRDRRMLRSFPRFQSTRYGDVVDKLKEVLRGSK